MASRLIDKVTKMVTVDYCRLTFVENPDGFLLDDEVCSLLRQEKNIEVIMKKIIFLLIMLPIMVQAQIKLQPKVAVSYGYEKIRLMDGYSKILINNI